MSTTKVELVASNHPQADENRFRTLEKANVFLKEAARSSANFKHFTSLWEQSNPKRKKGSAYEEKRKMLMELAERLADGSLRVRQRRALVGGIATAAEATTGFREPRPSRNFGTQLKIRDRPEPAPALPPEPPTNVKQQIDALKRAAKFGAPFCERCQERDSRPGGG